MRSKSAKNASNRSARSGCPAMSASRSGGVPASAVWRYSATTASSGSSEPLESAGPVIASPPVEPRPQLFQSAAQERHHGRHGLVHSRSDLLQGPPLAVLEYHGLAHQVGQLGQRVGQAQHVLVPAG